MQSLHTQCCTAMTLTSMVLCSYWVVLAGGQTCYLSGNSVCFFITATTVAAVLSNINCIVNFIPYQILMH